MSGSSWSAFFLQRLPPPPPFSGIGRPPLHLLHRYAVACCSSPQPTPPPALFRPSLRITIVAGEVGIIYFKKKLLICILENVESIFQNTETSCEK